MAEEEFKIPDYAPEVLQTPKRSDDHIEFALNNPYLNHPQSHSLRQQRKYYRDGGVCSKCEDGMNWIMRTLNIDTLADLEEGVGRDRDSRLLLTQIQQMQGLTRVITLVMLVASLVYLVTRVQSYVELVEFSKKAISTSKYANVVMLHYFTLAHGVTCVVISLFVFLMVKKSNSIDRRQYFFILGLSSLVTVLYFAAFMYLVYYTTGSSQQGNQAVLLLEGVIDILSSISNNTFSFVFAVSMNFLLIIGLFSLNLCSIYLADLAKSLEQRRTGGRGQNELELNSFVKK